MVKIVVYGLEIEVYQYDIHIKDSHIVDIPFVMRDILEVLKKELKRSGVTMETPLDHRSMRSMINEWIAHNNAYKLNYKPERTGSVDLNYPQKWYVKIIYWLASRIVL